MADNESKPNYSPSSTEDDDEEVSGSEEVSESSGSEISDSDSDQKQPKKPIIELSQTAAVKPPPPDLSESESEESGSEEEEEEEELPKKAVVVDSSIKPISSKPMEPEQVKKVAAPAKRPAPVQSAANEKDLKKVKTSANNAADDDTKKQLFQRLWSEEDEIVILKGMIDYKNEKNESPSGDMGAFHELIKKSLHVDVSRAQLVDKIRRLKKKFVNNVGREKNGKDRMFSKSHEQKGYELSKLIWGSESKKNGNGNNTNKGNVASTSTSTVVKSNGLVEKDVMMMDVDKSMDISRFVQFGRSDGPVLTEEIMKGGFESLEGSERVEIEAKWKELKKQELELFVKRMDLLKEQAVRVLEAVNSSRN